MPTKSVKQVSIEKFTTLNEGSEQDHLAVEEPLEIRIGFTKDGLFRHKPISITMRTPGSDFELAAGFLFTEGIISDPADLLKIHHCGPPNKEGAENTVRVDLNEGISVDIKQLERHFYTTSSCGVCGKSSIEALSTGVESRHRGGNEIRWRRTLIHELPEKLSQVQSVFERTGGLHASALFDTNGQLDIVREDVGRHNALDKVIGAKFLAGETNLAEYLLLLSGRISFELVQKALMAGISCIVAVGSPSSLAVELAEEYGMTLVGFVRDERFNVYCGGERIV